jgi:transposase-like protein
MHVISDAHVEYLKTLATTLEKEGLRDDSTRLKAVLADVQAGADEYTAAEAAEILGVTAQTIRNWVRAGIVPGRQDKTNHFYVPRQVLANTIAMQAALPEDAQDVSDTEIAAEIALYRAERKRLRSAE